MPLRFLALPAAVLLAQEAGRPDAQPSQFAVRFDAGAIVSLKPAAGAAETEYVAAGRRLGDVTIRYRQGGDWQSVNTASLAAAGTFLPRAEGREYEARYPAAGDPPALEVAMRFAVEERAVVWTLALRNATGQPLEVGDLAVPLPVSRSLEGAVSRGESGAVSRGESRGRAVILKHGLVSGHGSFLFWMRSDGVRPHLMLMPLAGTHLEYWDTQGFREYRAYIHSAAAGAEAKEKGTRWRQPHTALTLAPGGQPGDARSYGFKFRWAEDYDGVRQVLVDEGGVDVHVVPGMTVPSDLFARLALRTREEVRAVEAEFPEATRIDALARNGDYRLYQVHFSRLGENRLAVRYGDGRHLFLEFFATEPLETLIKKRAAFIARSQHRDPGKWYDGLISDWNMETQVLLGPDNPDRIPRNRIYAVTCDDPGLAKPAFLAAKNAEYPAAGEVEALDYYLQRFVWGGLQRTTQESHAHGIYGIPDWKTNRESSDPGRNGKLHLWRVYDYPHVVLLYFSMYRVARDHPQVKTALTAREYLERAGGTALAMFTVPMEIERWSAYRTGFYNELVIVELIDELEAAGMMEAAARLREHWERKVKSFVNEGQDLFRSEYAFDSTGFESTHAIAKYALRHADGPGETRSGIPLENARRFLETQLAANLFCRGWVEPAYYYLGSDYRGGGGNSYTLTYMSQMGGWSVLDHALNFAADPAPYLRLGYASYLSAWALMNTGTPESNHGYWYPGQANDGAAGGGFEPAPHGRTWLGQPHHRGAWYYACEIDLGYSGALRAAATVLADDPIFGRFCYGGAWRETPAGIEVLPRDGVRRRFHARLGGRKLSLTVERNRFSALRPLVVKEDLSAVRFVLDGEDPAARQVRLCVSGAAGEYVVRDGEQAIVTMRLKDGDETAVDVRLDGSPQPRTLAIEKQPGEGGK